MLQQYCAALGCKLSFNFSNGKAVGANMLYLSWFLDFTVSNQGIKWTGRALDNPEEVADDK